MPALYSHFVGHAVSVHDVVVADLRQLFQRRLTAQAAGELQLLQEMIQDVTLDDTQRQAGKLLRERQPPPHV